MEFVIFENTVNLIKEWLKCRIEYLFITKYLLKSTTSKNRKSKLLEIKSGILAQKLKEIYELERIVIAF